MQFKVGSGGITAFAPGDLREDAASADVELTRRGLTPPEPADGPHLDPAESELSAATPNLADGQALSQRQAQQQELALDLTDSGRGGEPGASVTTPAVAELAELQRHDLVTETDRAVPDGLGRDGQPDGPGGDRDGVMSGLRDQHGARLELAACFCG